MKSITKIEHLQARVPAAKIRVAAYCRVSTGMDDQLVSLETQKLHYEEAISANPDYEFAGLYYDEGITGTSKEKRPAFMKMITDCEAGKIDRIVTKSLSRFARNTTDCLEIVRKLISLGVTVFFEKENLDTGSMESELLLSIMSSLAESESVSISENNKWGIRHRFENGTYKIGYAPYGYDVKDGIFFVNEEEAKWVKWIFEQALAGKTSHIIARELNGMKVPAKKGGAWHQATIRGILENEKYTGDCLFQKTFTDFRFQRHKNRNDRDQFFLADHHEAIISHEDFEAAAKLIGQRAMEKNIKKGDARYQNRYPFTQKIFCGECASGFKRKVCYTGKLKYAVWACKGHLHDVKSCSVKAVREDQLQNAFTTMLNKLIFARVEILAALLDAVQGEAHKDALRRINEINEELERCTERQQTLITIMSKGYLEPALFTQENNDLGAKAERLEKERDTLMKDLSGNAEMTKALEDLMKFAGHTETLAEFDGDLVGRFVDHITVHSQNEVTFHLKCGLNLKEGIG